MYQITNIYALAAFGTIGGALFGFDVSSMSAWLNNEHYLEYFNYPDSNMQGGVRLSNHSTIDPPQQPQLTNHSDHRFHVRRIIRRSHLRRFHRRQMGPPLRPDGRRHSLDHRRCNPMQRTKRRPPDCRQDSQRFVSWCDFFSSILSSIKPR